MPIGPLTTARVKTARVKTARVKTARVKTARVKTARVKTARVKTARAKGRLAVPENTTVLLNTISLPLKKRHWLGPITARQAPPVRRRALLRIPTTPPAVHATFSPRILRLLVLNRLPGAVGFA